jgi:hypothetical protein
MRKMVWIFGGWIGNRAQIIGGYMMKNIQKVH